MRIDFHRHFDKSFAKLTNKQKERFQERLTVFVKNFTAPELNNHALRGRYQGYRSINVTGDIRAIFIFHGPKQVEFVFIGSHHRLYR
ncbi:MAG: type II toxin-antitoxin system mRNA interferase toxin, RelE/StbE family [Candidatus Paceibacterota bacterium]